MWGTWDLPSSGATGISKRSASSSVPPPKRVAVSTLSNEGKSPVVRICKFRNVVEKLDVVFVHLGEHQLFNWKSDISHLSQPKARC